MSKADALKHWRELPADQEPLEHMRPIPYKAAGSRYGACGIRIDGNPQFIDAVLSRLKGLIAGENHVTRLELARATVDGRGLGRSFDNADAAAEVCYIRLHMRGREGAIASAVFDRELDGATAAYESTLDKRKR